MNFGSALQNPPPSIPSCVVMHGRRIEGSSSDHDQHRHFKNHNYRNRHCFWVLVEKEEYIMRRWELEHHVNEEGAKDQEPKKCDDRTVERVLLHLLSRLFSVFS